MKISIANKKNLVFILKWLAFWLPLVFIDLYFNISITQTLIENREYSLAFIGIAFALMLGKFEGYYYHSKNQLPDTSINKPVKQYNEHTLFTFIRACFLIPVFMLTNIYMVIAYALCFPFFHDGMYYLTRNKLDAFIYPKKWKDHSNTSTAFLTKYLNFKIRVILLIAGVSLLIYKTLHLW